MLVLLAVGCGGGGSAKHDALERELMKTSVTICGRDCRHYNTADVRCDETSVALEGRRWHRCLKIYEDDGPREYVCAASWRDDRGYVVREKSDCRR